MAVGSQMDLSRRGVRSVPPHLRKFTVQESKPGETETVRIGKDHMQVLKAKPGDYVWVCKFSDIGGKLRGKAAPGYPEDENKDIVRLSKDLIETGKTLPGSEILVGDRVRVLSGRFMDFNLT